MRLRIRMMTTIIMNKTTTNTNLKAEEKKNGIGATLCTPQKVVWSPVCKSCKNYVMKKEKKIGSVAQSQPKL